MNEELNIFFLFFVLGGGMGAIFLAGRYLSGKIKKQKTKMAAETILLTLLFCLYGILFFVLSLSCNLGVFRLYMVFASIAGFWLVWCVQKLFANLMRKIYTKYHENK